MKYFTVAALLAMATSAFAGTLSTTPSVRAEKVITCYNIGTSVDPAPSTTVIDDWCNNHAIGHFVAPGATIWARYDYGTFTILVSGKALTNCGGFTVDGNCNRLLRLPLDGCNTRGVNGKQGGFETDLCGQWRYDPGSNGSDF
ncbi:hypothetical protein BYT27DRAFT_7237187 [Phlegmacium glaucopus]|nr:hypothetical protein BYT27DRAFT_7237187 [Phlegmacium glaucopus]